MNRKILFNDNWEFAKSELGFNDYSSLNFSPVDLPHDWLIYDSLNLYENSIGWYRRNLEHRKTGQETIIYFDGVYMESTLYVNNQFVGEWKYGYSSFEFNITEFLHDGENEILVKVVHQSPNSRWYSGAGIYRNVWLKTREKNYIETDGLYISTREEKHGWIVDIETELNICEKGQLTHKLMDQDTLIAATTGTAKEKGVYTAQLMIQSPKLWDMENPNLYHLETTLFIDDKKVEVVNQNVGFRSIVLDPDQGFLLNGKKSKLNGVCEHHDLGALGAAFNVSALKRRFHLLKEMGVNAIRTAHNMPAKEFMELADTMGFLVITEAFDMWERSKTPYDYARFFQEWAYKDVQSWVRRDRNHPSLLLWSIGNEIYDTHADERGQEITKQLVEYVRQFDPKQNAGITIGSNYMPWENAQKCADIVKIAGYNYAEKYYHVHHEKYPDWVIYGSETASTVQSRGIYHFPYEKSILADDDEQCSALGNSSTSWGAKSTEACIIADRDAPFSLGTFIWTGFDYIGEPTPYHTKNSYLGQIDTATFPKDSYCIYQAAWTDYKKNPMVHIFPYWDFNEGQLIDVRICSNAPKVELLFNGESIGTFHPDHSNGKQLTGWWKLPYQKGEIKAVAYDETGQVIATDSRRSFGNASSIQLTPDKNKLKADGTDLIFLEISMLDHEGNLVENANNRVEVAVKGAGRLIGLDNGDSTDYDSYKGTSRRLFSGKLMAIIAAKKEAGKIQVEVTSNGMKNKVIELEALESIEDIKGISASTENTQKKVIMGNDKELPLRKVEIVSEEGQHFHSSLREIQVYAKLHPEKTDYHDLEWSVVTDIGVESNIATIESNGNYATVSALGDGEFRVRCKSSNGTDKTKIISELELKATELGTAYKNPYKFISAGLYDYSKGEIGNGNERGIATSRDEETQVGFRNIDFGRDGSDMITIPVFALSNEPYMLQIWEGMPDETESEILADVIYQKESKWNVYQEETYRLSKKLKGITSLCFVLKQKVHIKGFTFIKQNRAFEKHLAIDMDHIYGDSYTLNEEAVEGIGNNVTLEFAEFNFSEEFTDRIYICGHSPIDKNTIHIQFLSESGESNQIVEFNKTDNYEEKEFMLNRIEGMTKVCFIFLPGSNFNFKWFRFGKSSI
ncbi:beta-galactosidase [Gracilibacillus ureilyticus]|uniref:Beta-galactosidase n=1 Tax=Gracilibacillus ureilyticus TaxID=531814 RepID=A0A1H9PTU1_9BACI|nr:glycoside hydrolase family 2 TIM barrel-domain containing protein [Gracilibacillus ureilyticus]SER51013.1 beta-galactosidase [Gracilibacillus ureilyticus]